MTTLVVLETLPDSLPQGPEEVVPYELDVAPWLGVGETPTLIVSKPVKLIEVATDTLYPDGLLNVATISGTSIRVTVTSLQLGHSYDLVFPFQAAAGKEFAPTLRLVCRRR